MYPANGIELFTLMQCENTSVGSQPSPTKSSKCGDDLLVPTAWCMGQTVKGLNYLEGKDWVFWTSSNKTANSAGAQT